MQRLKPGLEKKNYLIPASPKINIVILSPNLLPEKIWRLLCNPKSRVYEMVISARNIAVKLPKFFCRLHLLTNYNYMHFLGAFFGHGLQIKSSPTDASEAFSGNDIT